MHSLYMHGFISRCFFLFAVCVFACLYLCLLLSRLDMIVGPQPLSSRAKAFSSPSLSVYYSQGRKNSTQGSEFPRLTQSTHLICHSHVTWVQFTPQSHNSGAGLLSETWRKTKCGLIYQPFVCPAYLTTDHGEVMAMRFTKHALGTISITVELVFC